MSARKGAHARATTQASQLRKPYPIAVWQNNCSTVSRCTTQKLANKHECSRARSSFMAAGPSLLFPRVPASRLPADYAVGMATIPNPYILVGYQQAFPSSVYYTKAWATRFTNSSTEVFADSCTHSPVHHLFHLLLQETLTWLPTPPATVFLVHPLPHRFSNLRTHLSLHPFCLLALPSNKSPLADPPSVPRPAWQERHNPRE